MSIAGTTLSLLDRETRALHPEVDRGWSRLLRGGDATREDYLHQLMVAYGLEVPLELACSRTPGLAAAIDLRGRSRARLIAQDLVALGVRPDDVEPCCELAPFPGPAEALAWMYALERPTLRYPEVRDDLVARFADLARATTYLAAYSRDASKRWSELGIALDRICISDPLEHRVVDAARDACRAIIECQRASTPALRGVPVVAGAPAPRAAYSAKPTETSTMPD